jgi:hypothetical protein
MTKVEDGNQELAWELELEAETLERGWEDR